MSEDFYANAYFFFVCKRRSDTFLRFCERFNLMLSPSFESFDVLNYDTGEIVHSESTLDGIIDYLDQSAESRFDFYLESRDGNSFMFCYRPDNLHVMGIPYCYLDPEKLVATLVSFSVIYGWGWQDDAPPENFIEMKNTANNARLPFMRYSEGKLMEPNC